MNRRVTTLALVYTMAVKLGYNVPSSEVKKGTYLKKYVLFFYTLHPKRLAPIGAARDRRRERNNRVNALSHCTYKPSFTVLPKPPCQELSRVRKDGEMATSDGKPRAQAIPRRCFSRARTHASSKRMQHAQCSARGRAGRDEIGWQQRVDNYSTSTSYRL